MVTSNRTILFVLSQRMKPTVRVRVRVRGVGGKQTNKQTAKNKSPKPRRWTEQSNHSLKPGGAAVHPPQPCVSLHTEVTDQLLLPTWQIPPHTSLRTLLYCTSPLSKQKKRRQQSHEILVKLHLPKSNRVEKYCMLAAGGVKPFIHLMAIYGNTQL